jgi:RNA polymerase sigma-70 factor (ECF subfamily)
VNRPSEEQIAAWYPRLFRTALRLTGNREDSADLTQQAFCKALGAWERFDGRSRPTTWLHGILVNCVRDQFRRSAVRAVEELQEWSLDNSSVQGGCVAEELGRQEQLARLREAINGLDHELQQPFVAAVLDGYTYGEVADMLGIPVGTVGNRVYRARKRLHSVMLESFPEEIQ